MIDLISHEHPSWIKRYQKHGRTNGAQTYSEEIVKHHLPLWETVLQESTTVFTPGFMNNREWQPKADSKFCIHYLHNFPLTGDIKQKMRNIINKHHFSASNILFVVSYYSQYVQLSRLGYWALYLPMAVTPPPWFSTWNYGEGHIVYFGNLNVKREIKEPKYTVYNKLKQACARTGWKLHTVQDMSQNSAWKKVAQFKYGIAVSRCYQEMQAMGIKTLIAGQQFGGLVTCPQDFDVQIQSNIDGRTCTFDTDMERCLLSLDQAYPQYRNILDLEVQDDLLDRMYFAMSDIYESRVSGR